MCTHSYSGLKSILIWSLLKMSTASSEKSSV